MYIYIYIYIYISMHIVAYDSAESELRDSNVPCDSKRDRCLVIYKSILWAGGGIHAIGME